MSWHFLPMTPGELNIDPIEHEFFANESLEGITAALVREAIQNSLDASSEDEETVRVRFVLGETDAGVGSTYLKDLLPHVRAAVEPGTELPSLASPLRFLAVEDEGTRGLEGDPRQYEDDDGAGSHNDFYYFWRNVGRSRKDSTDRGRWGLGKTVFAAASRLRAFFGLTVRRSDGRALLMGQSVLRIHRVGSQRYRPYGYYGRRENGLTMPLDGAHDLAEFRQSFRLRRESPGFSVVVPWPDEEITRDRLLEAVLCHYFHPLLSGRLEVEIETAGEPSAILRHEGLEAEVRRWETSRRLLPVIELTRWGHEPEPEAVVEIAAPAKGKAPKLTEDLFTAADLEKLRGRFDDGRRIAIDAKIFVEPKSGAPQEASFRLLMERDPEQGSGQGHFVRQGITVENAGAKRPRGVRWILIVDDETLSSFLGDAENPAHTEWQRSSRKFKEKYRRGPSTLDFVRSFPARAVALLSTPAQDRDPELLRDIFSLSDAAAVQSKHKQRPDPAGEQETTAEASIPVNIGRNGSLRLARVRTGFRLRGRVDAEAPRRFCLLAAYDVLRGDPFRRYSELDFRMDRTIRAEVQGAKILNRSQNRLEIEIEREEFELLVTRFDPKRDLRVKVHPLEETS